MKIKIQECDVPNSNGIIFPKEVMEKAISEFRNRLPMMGQIHEQNNHILNIEKVSHEINDIYFEDNFICGNIKILNTPNGKLVKECINNTLEFKGVAIMTGTLDNSNAANVTIKYVNIEPLQNNKG